MACGDKYRHLVVTSTGLSVANPYDDVPSFTDYEEWKTLAAGLLATAGEHFQALGGMVGQTPQAFLDWTAIRPRRNDAIEKYDALPSAFANFSPAENIAAAIASCLASVCVIDLCDAAIVKHGGTPPVIPGAPPPRKPDGVFSGTLSDLKTIAVIGGLVVAAAVIVPRLQKR